MTDLLRLLVPGLLLLACAGCSREGRLTHIADEKVAVTHELPAGATRLRVDLLKGSITIQPGAPGEVAVEAAARRASVSAEGLEALRAVDARPALVAGGEPGLWVLRGPRLPEGHEAPAHQIILRSVVRVPPALAVEARSGFGHMGAVGRRAPLRLETAHGDLRLDDCHGDAVLRSGRGVVIVDQHRGSLDVELGVWDGEPVEVREGDTMQVFIDELGDDGVRIAAPNANVQLHVPGDAEFVMDVVTGAGRGKNSFGVPILPLEGRRFGLTMRGVVGDGGPPVRITIEEAGNVSVRARDGG